MRMKFMATLTTSAMLASVVVLGVSRADDTKIWKATADDIKAACRVKQIADAQEAYKAKEKVYAKDKRALVDRGFIRKELADDTFDHYEYNLTSDEKTFKVIAKPHVADSGFWTYMAKDGGKKVRCAFKKEPVEKDQKVKVAWYKIEGAKEWQKGEMSINEKEELHVTAEGEWWVGDKKKWKPCGAEGTDEKSSFGDFRVFKGDAKLGCLCVRIEGDKDGAWPFKKDCMTCIAGKSGCPEFRINDSKVDDNSGELTVYLLVMASANEDKD